MIPEFDHHASAGQSAELREIVLKGTALLAESRLLVQHLEWTMRRYGREQQISRQLMARTRMNIPIPDRRRQLSRVVDQEKATGPRIRQTPEGTARSLPELT